MPALASIARAFDWDERKKSMEQKYGDALPYLRRLYGEIFGHAQPAAKSA
jgi:hypothetical protein